jgi:16S rRNA (guanine(966)-N(2))-methyltransferase RsmD
MRIVAGSRRGQRLKSPTGAAIRPTPDRVREALFSILGERVLNARFLDLYAGTGAVGLEALSRGAAFAHFVEESRKARELITRNIELLKFEANVRVTGGKLPAALGRIGKTGPGYDIVFADPPYRTGDAALLLGHAELPGLCNPDAWLVIETDREGVTPTPGWSSLSVRGYGDTQLCLFARADVP